MVAELSSAAGSVLRVDDRTLEILFFVPHQGVFIVLGRLGVGGPAEVFGGLGRRAFLEQFLPQGETEEGVRGIGGDVRAE